MSSSTRWISEHDVVSVLGLGGAVDALRRAFAEEGMGRTTALEKTMVSFGDHGTLHALGAAFDNEGLVGTKTWAHTPGGADPVLLLFDARTGALIAVVEAFAMGQLRTAGTAALATDLLARANSSTMAIIGTGKQAMAQVAAVIHVRPIKEVRVFSRDPVNRAEFVGRLVDELKVASVDCSSTAEAVSGSDVITLVTRAREPVLHANMLLEGVHINSVGSIDLERKEFEPEILADCASVVTDSVAQAGNFSAELREFYGTDSANWSTVRSLGELVSTVSVPRSPSDVTLFKGMGSGVEDMALGAAVLARLGAQNPVVSIKRAGRAKVDFLGSADNR